MSPSWTPVTVVGRLVTDVTTRVVAGGAKVADFRIACQERQYDKELGTWVDGDRMYVRVSCWRNLAEHAAESLHKGDQVVASGRLKLAEYTTENGANRTSLEVTANAIGPDLALHTVMVNRPHWAIHPDQQVLINPPPSAETPAENEDSVPDKEKEETPKAA